MAMLRQVQQRGVVCVNVSLEEAIVIYARAMLGRFKELAQEKTLQHIKALAASSDHEGVMVFERVLSHIEAIAAQSKRIAMAHGGATDQVGG